MTTIKSRSSHQNTKKFTLLKFYNTHIHNNYYYYIGMHDRKAKQRMPNDLNTISRFFKKNLGNLKTQIQLRYIKYIVTDTKFNGVFGKYDLKHCMRYNDKYIPVNPHNLRERLPIFLPVSRMRKFSRA